MGEILPKLTDEITKLCSQGIPCLYLKFIPPVAAIWDVQGLSVGRAQVWVWDTL